MSTPPERWWGRPLAESRGALELARLSVDPVLRGHGIRSGDGRPVVLMPGFLAVDQWLLVLAAWLRRIGHRPYTCGFVANVDCSDRALDRVERRVEKLHRRHGRRVALVGHSRGGHYARALAHRRPDRVSHAVSLGADLQRMPGVSAPTQAAVAAARRGVCRAPSRPRRALPDCGVHVRVRPHRARPWLRRRRARDDRAARGRHVGARRREALDRQRHVRRRRGRVGALD
jgi:triacylglycerol lipase